MIGNQERIAAQEQLSGVQATRKRRRGGPRYEDPSYKFMKRSADIVLSAFFLVLLFPVFLIIAILVFLADGGPVFFKQRRLGQHGKVFMMYKFRTMRKDAEAALIKLLESDPEAKAEFEQTYKLRNDPRIIRFGGFLRKSSLDELPQLMNVLMGPMTLVGPRPIVEKEASMFGDRIDTYYKMKPGCAGLWQCGGRNDVSYDERIALNEEYYETAGFRRDVQIMWFTLVSIFKGGGAY